MLGTEAIRPVRSIAGLLAWGRKNKVTMPSAFVDWAKLDDGSLLQKYSNDDHFWFDEPPALVTTPDKVRGLLFHRENQGNCDWIVALDEGDDPRVLMAWLGRPPWVVYADRFSDAVFAQVFDWQYKLEFRPDDPNYKEITYYGELHRETAQCVAELRQQYEEVVSTRFHVDRVGYVEYRFVHSPIRMTALVTENGTTDVCITGPAEDGVRLLLTDLESVLSR